MSVADIILRQSMMLIFERDVDLFEGKSNLMKPEGLATCIGPSLFRTEAEVSFLQAGVCLTQLDDRSSN